MDCGRDDQGGNGRCVPFFVKNVYEEIKMSNEEVKWWKAVWFTQCIPKHAFIMWMAINKRLMTQDRMKMWGSYDMMVCSLCYKQEESHNHLFFICPYSNKLWKNVMIHVSHENYPDSGIHSTRELVFQFIFMNP
nr:reverse transcriptase zinc-binding domain-containing protein [Tanacetum cinerariifolium]